VLGEALQVTKRCVVDWASFQKVEKKPL
jgi:hypothetical protein